MAKIAPEGIVQYSFSGNQAVPGEGLTRLERLNGVSFNSKLNDGSIGIVADNLYIDYTDVYGTKYKQNEKLVLTKSFIETLDLVSEGQIEGLVSGEYIYSGALYETGYRSAVFSGFAVPTGTDSNGNSWESSRWLRSIYYNETPILSDRGQFNFQNVETAFVLGTANGDNLRSLISEETSSRVIGERLRGGEDQSKYYRILNKNCKGIILNVKVNSLNEAEDDGDIKRVKLDWQISYRPIFTKITKKTDFGTPFNETIFGKITSAGGYIQSTRIDFDMSSFFSKEVSVTEFQSPNPQTSTITTPTYSNNFINNPDFLGWEIKVKRLTDDSTSAFRQDATYVESITELYGNALLYPNSAIVKSLFNAEFFSNVPERAFDLNLLKVKIPGNYNPITKSYATGGFATTNGYWNGEFTTGKQWTNNPAWCFYDLLTNKRYGLGRYVDDLAVDKFSLYEIGQYCDQLVYDADGGLEPRFTCNLLIGSREEAYKVINDLASVFRGMTYYANGNIYAVSDTEKSSRVTFTNANVEDGDFSYNSTSKKNRQSIAIVRYNNPNDFYKPAMEYVEDTTAIRRYGIRELDLVAFGCTSRGQAIRLGRWALLSNNQETETIQFTAGIEAATLRPGDLFKVVDSHRKTKRYGGRIWTLNDLITGATVTLDSTVPLENTVQYKLSVLTPSYQYDSTQVTGLTAGDIPSIRRSFLQNILFSGNQATTSDNKTVLGLTTGFDKTNYSISGNPIFSIELGPLSESYTGSRYFYNDLQDTYRALNIKESDVNKYEVVGLQYWGQKFIEIDSGINYQRPAISVSQRTPASPYNLSLNPYNDDASNNNQIIHYSFLIDNYTYINNYRVYATTGLFGNNVPPDNFLAATLPVDVIQSVYKPIYSGTYKFRVYSYNETDNIYSNSYASGSIDVNRDLDITNVIISSLQLVA